MRYQGWAGFTFHSTAGAILGQILNTVTCRIVVSLVEVPACCKIQKLANHQATTDVLSSLAEPALSIQPWFKNVMSPTWCNLGSIGIKRLLLLTQRKALDTKGVVIQTHKPRHRLHERHHEISSRVRVVDESCDTSLILTVACRIQCKQWNGNFDVLTTIFSLYTV